MKKLARTAALCAAFALPAATASAEQSAMLIAPQPQPTSSGDANGALVALVVIGALWALSASGNSGRLSTKSAPDAQQGATGTGTVLMDF